jgi:hypothetical protein
MPDVRRVGEILKQINDTIDRKRKSALVAALREAADALEKDDRPWEEATAAVFGRIIRDQATKHRVTLDKQLEEKAVESTRTLVRHARRKA